MSETVLRQSSTSSLGKPYSTYQAANNNCSFSILQSEFYSTRIYHELKHTKQTARTRYPTGSYMTMPPSSRLPSARYSTAVYGKEPCLPCGNALTFDQCLKFDHQRQLIKNLRPISLSPVLSKCLDKFMCMWIMDNTMDQIDPQQYGSIKGTSTVHSLVELVHKWKSVVETPGTIVRILLVDFSKTFDRVEYHIFMTKCASLVLPNVVIKWLTSFLCQRKQRAKIGSVKSEYTTVNAGVPQGTIFGPFGFLHHINYLQTV